jgi:hypothetical protein
MTREQKTKSKGSHTRNAKSKQRVAPAGATLIPDTTQTTADTTNTVSDETQIPDPLKTTGTTNASNVTTSSQQEQGEASPPSSVQQSAARDQQVPWTGVQPSWPSWPTSKPGPRSTPPAPGMHSINKFRPEQFEEVGYNQQTGEPATQSPFRSLPDARTTGPTSFDQPTAQDVLGKRKQRL